MEIPTLDEVLRAFPDVPVNIEIKERSSSLVESLSDLIEQLGVDRSTCVGAEWDDITAQYRRLQPTACTYAGGTATTCEVLSHAVPLDWGSCGDFDLFAVPVSSGGVDVITPSFVERAHRRGKAVFAWTIDEPVEMEELIRLGVDGIMTDRPDELSAVLEERSEAR